MSKHNSIELTDYFEFVDPETIRIIGHRLGIEHVLKLYQKGHSPEYIACEYPGLDLEIIYAAITYFLNNREEMEAYLKRKEEQNEKAYQIWSRKASPLIERLKLVREKNPKYE